MLNHIAIGSLITLDLQTRILTRTDRGESVTLPQSACLCLAALVEASGEVLSQEQLMEIGWRSAGVEVTDNSVRVMITKLRRAFTQLEMQDVITLMAVTRTGYRLVVRSDSSEHKPFTDAEPIATSEATEASAAPEAVIPSSPLRPVTCYSPAAHHPEWAGGGHCDSHDPAQPVRF